MILGFSYLEFHNILRQRSRLVREDVFDLSEFFVQIRSPSQGESPRWLVIHFVVPVNKICLKLTMKHGFRKLVFLLKLPYTFLKDFFYPSFFDT